MELNVVLFRMRPDAFFLLLGRRLGLMALIGLSFDAWLKGKRWRLVATSLSMYNHESFCLW